MGKSKKNKKTGKPRLTKAEKNDIHTLYEESVQCVEAEIDFVDDTFREIRGRRPTTLREDFCGSMNTSCEWVRRRKTSLAYCIDIDEDVLNWGRRNNLSRLNKLQKKRVNIINADVTTALTPGVDVVLAMNFSYWIFKDRQTMTAYYRHIYKNLSADGIFFLDCFGGPEAFKEMEEETEYDGFTYVWDQHRYSPVTGDGLFYIHFKFDDGSRIRRAFTYDWRVWTIPELREMLTDAGFTPHVYWEGSDGDGEGNGVFTRSSKGEADESWIAYIVAEK
jgi:hypothetical protein